MSKKVLIISSSPRKDGNSEILCDEFRKGAITSGNEVEKISISDKKIGYCLGCGACNSSLECVQKDDMAKLLEKMIAADVIVLATPVYFYSMSAQLKAFIDRTVPRYTEITDKEFYYIVTAADTEISSMQKTIESLRGFTLDCLHGAVEKGIIYGIGAWNKGEIVDTPAMKQAYESGINV